MKLFRRDRCYNGGGGHKFEPRYSEKPSGVTFKTTRGYDIDSMRKLINLQEYEYDVCVWCGEIKRG